MFLSAARLLVDPIHVFRRIGLLRHQANHFRSSYCRQVFGGKFGIAGMGEINYYGSYPNVWISCETKEELQEHPHSKLGVDDFSQYAPLAAAYVLRLCGIKGLHDYVDLTIISGTAYLLTGLSVYGVKTLTRVERPDGSTRNSFPSGHTATAFAGAEILRREYWNVSPWIGVAGYAVAAGTGFLRMYNNRHWLTDVVAGAGFGILCAQAAYWLYPVITKTVFRKRYKTDIFLSPYISQDSSRGLALQLIF